VRALILDRAQPRIERVAQRPLVIDGGRKVARFDPALRARYWASACSASRCACADRGRINLEALRPVLRTLIIAGRHGSDGGVETV
jgi:hypothetical protein